MFHGGEGIIPAYIRNEPEVMNAEAIIAATQAGYSLSRASSQASSGSTSTNVNLDAKEFKEGVLLFREVISVLQKEGLWSKFSRDEFQDATEDLDRKDSAPQ